MKKSKKEKPPIEVYACPMSSAEFLYDFIDVSEFSTYRDQWNEQDLDPLMLVYPDRIDIWLLPDM
jgi:hypothetical protein